MQTIRQTERERERMMCRKRKNEEKRNKVEEKIQNIEMRGRRMFL